ncbi:MAG: hypothetical protein IKQ61_04085 [Spirochaetales bacterium]|nr:hypothetical protein [Spirochaetales bacterium]
MIDLFDLDVDSLDSYIRIEKLSNENVPVSFPMKKSEYFVYSDYIMKNALAYQNLFITNTYGSFLIDFAADLAYKISINFAACRFLTVDADIDNNPDSPVFYEKNGFCRMTDRKYTKKTKMVCMYKDIFSK